jgi:hypothetical protein
MAGALNLQLAGDAFYFGNDFTSWAWAVCAFCGGYTRAIKIARQRQAKKYLKMPIDAFWRGLAA